MKKAIAFLRSMRFGIVLLILIAGLSVAGSVIPQERAASWYVETYPAAHSWLFLLQADDIFHSWYFAVLLGLLSLNLAFCTGSRLAMLIRTKQPFPKYGTFFVHLAILLTIAFGAATLYLAETVDRTCLPGEALTLDDGTTVAVESFRIEDETGKLDYASEIRVTLPDGRESERTTIRVNHPLAFGPYKVYQQTHGTAGAVNVRNDATGGTDDFVLTEPVFLSVDSVNGLWYEALYPGYVRAEDGTMTLITSTAGRYEDPVYQVLLASDGVYTPVLAFPGESVSVAGMTFSLGDSVEYPGLRIKRTPPFVRTLLFGAFGLMIFGLFVTFFLKKEDDA